MRWCKIILVCIPFFGLSQEDFASNYFTDFDKLYENNLSNSIKFNIFGLTKKDLILSYERALSLKSSMELRLKWIGLPFGEKTSRGLGADVGYKLRLNYFLKSSKDNVYVHVLQGSYFKPLVGFHYINEKGVSMGQWRRYRILSIGLELGMQYAFNNSTTLDFYVGVHRYAGSEKSVINLFEATPSFERWNAADLYGRENSAVSIGWRFGFLFGSYKNERRMKR